MIHQYRKLKKTFQTWHTLEGKDLGEGLLKAVWVFLSIALQQTLRLLVVDRSSLNTSEKRERMESKDALLQRALGGNSWQ